MKAECQRANSAWPTSFLCVYFWCCSCSRGMSVRVGFGYEFVVTHKKREYDDNEFILLHLNLLVPKAMQQFKIAQCESRHRKCLFITQNVLCLGLCKPVYYVLLSSHLFLIFGLVFRGQNVWDIFVRCAHNNKPNEARERREKDLRCTYNWNAVKVFRQHSHTHTHAHILKWSLCCSAFLSPSSSSS